MSHFPHTITRASAGSGKTFALSNRYLELAHHGESPERILATTFARKAAGEILDRILIRLAEAASDEAKRKELANFIAGGDSLTPARCRELLRQFAGQLHKLRVGTIDSFFAQVARTFALELSVPPAWRIVDPIEDDDLRDEAIEAVLAAHDEKDLVRLVNLLTKGDAQRRISGLLRDTVGGLYQVFLDSSPNAWEKLPRYSPLQEDKLEAALENLRELPVAAKGLIKGRDQDYALAMAGDWKAFLTKGITKCIVNDQAKYRSQTIESHVVAIYQPLIEHAKAVLLGRTANFTVGAREFLTHFDEQYRRLKHRRRAMLFDDVTRAVMQLAEIGDADGLAFRLDGHVDHLLLDEFQDTSPQQWTAIRPLAQRVVAGEETSFYCVGDVKQAIYGWRGGVAEIFVTVEDQLGKMEEQTLAKSYRSSPIIIDAVNQVFENLGNHSNLGRAEEAIDAFQSEFPHHETAKDALPGYACLKTAPLDEQNQNAATLQFAAEQIAQLVEQSPGRSIGVLCRTNDAIAALIYELRRRDIHASEEGGNPLTDSAAVQLILALLKMADHPGDTIARYHLATSVWKDKWNIKGRNDEQAALRVSREVRSQLVHEGYGPTILGWADELAPECDAREQSRLNQLVELAYTHAPSAPLRATEFVRLVQEQRIADPTAHPVRVTTIHRAKGLEFDVVVLPELDKSITGQPDKFVVHRQEGTGPIDCIFEHVSQDLLPLLPKEFQAMIAEATRRDVTETMCVLYVALTRAIHALHLIIAPSKENEGKFPRTLAGLLRCTLKDTQSVSPSATVWEHGDPKWFDQITSDGTGASTTPTTAAMKPLKIELAPPLAGHSRSLDRIAPSRLHAAKTTSLARVFAAAENTYAMDRGSLIHACFEQIEWLDDGPPKRDALRRAVAGLAGGDIDVDAAMGDFFKMLKMGDTPALLSRERYASHAGKVVVRNEYDFAYADDEGRIVQGSIDRLVLLYDGDNPVAADIIDFKTDAETTGAAERHHEQLNAYRAAACRNFKLPPQSITTRLLMVKNGTIIELD